MKKLFRIIVLIFVSTFFLNSVKAQPGLDDDDIEDAPLDGGIGILLTAGAAYGLLLARMAGPTLLSVRAKSRTHFTRKALASKRAIPQLRHNINE